MSLIEFVNLLAAMAQPVLAIAACVIAVTLLARNGVRY
jgi:hypothetical protein